MSGRHCYFLPTLFKVNDSVLIRLYCLSCQLSAVGAACRQHDGHCPRYGGQRHVSGQPDVWQREDRNAGDSLRC